MGEGSPRPATSSAVSSPRPGWWEQDEGERAPLLSLRVTVVLGDFRWTACRSPWGTVTGTEPGLGSTVSPQSREVGL